MDMIVLYAARGFSSVGKPGGLRFQNMPDLDKEYNGDDV